MVILLTLNTPALRYIVTAWNTIIIDYQLQYFQNLNEIITAVIYSSDIQQLL